MNKNIMTTVLLTTLFVGLSALVLQSKSTPPIKFSLGSERVVQNKVEVIGLTLERSILSEALAILGDDVTTNEPQTGILDLHFENVQFTGFHGSVTLSVMVDNPELIDYDTYKTLQNLNFAIIKNISISPQRAFPKNTLSLKYGFSKIASNDIWEYPNKGLKILFYTDSQIFEYNNTYIK
jgi:hypothetical protein